MPIAPPCPPRPRYWGLRAALSGIIACGLGALVCTAHYVTLPGALKLDWALMPLALAMFVIIGGISTGLCIGGTTLLAARRGASLPGLMGAGAVGGVIAGIAPGILGIAGFGSLHAPYAGTGNIMAALLVGAIAFVALWSPQVLPRTGSRLRHLGLSAVASVISLGAFGMIAWGVANTLDLVPSFDRLVAASDAMGIMAFAAVGGVLLGAAGGAAIGAACGLVGRIDRHT